jgi:lysyl endopeptidase
MKNVQRLLALAALLLCHALTAQVRTDINSKKLIDNSGYYEKNYSAGVNFNVGAKDIAALLAKEAEENKKSPEGKPFKLAEPSAIDINIAKQMQWVYDGGYAFGKFTIQLTGAYSTSINFDKFYLPEGTEMFIYNAGGNMITGPVTAAENNANGIWGSWVYAGPEINIEIKTPAAAVAKLVLHSNNVAYGYKEVYMPKAGGFGQSGSCNINVICPLGNGWEPERNSVAIILDANGSTWCSGAMVMNTCNNNRPYFLTANHCYTGSAGQNVAAWRFNFQAWSTTCPNPGTDAVGVTFNGSSLRANSAPSDFCLLELNTIPAANSGIRYSGWSRSTTPSQISTGIHHPKGDVMKISRSNTPLAIASGFGSVNQHWQVIWAQGVTEGGSSGSPIFDQNHRIVGQLSGGVSGCNSSAQRDYYGRFDLSWTGGGTTATRLSTWLDPLNSGAGTRNTTIVSALTDVNPNSYSIAGPAQFCTSATYTIPNLPAGATVQWYVNTPGPLSFTTSGNLLTVTRNQDVDAVIDATITLCGAVIVKHKNIRLGGNPITISATQSGCDNVTFTVAGAAPGAVFNWSSGLNTLLYNGISTTASTTNTQIWATGTNDYAILNTTNTCQQAVQKSFTYTPFERTIDGLYPEYVSCGDHLSVSVNTSPYDTYYRWYVNNTLVNEGTAASYYCTCYYLGHDARHFGNNTIRVEVETSCGANSTGTGDFYTYCSVFFRQAANAEIFPNPGKDNITVRLKQDVKQSKATALRQIRELRIIDKTGNVKGVYKYSGNIQSVNINIGNLPDDIYYIIITDGRHTERLPLSVRK